MYIERLYRNDFLIRMNFLIVSNVITYDAASITQNLVSALEIQYYFILQKHETDKKDA